MNSSNPDAQESCPPQSSLNTHTPGKWPFQRGKRPSDTPTSPPGTHPAGSTLRSVFGHGSTRQTAPTGVERLTAKQQWIAGQTLSESAANDWDPQSFKPFEKVYSLSDAQPPHDTLQTFVTRNVSDFLQTYHDPVNLDKRRGCADHLGADPKVALAQESIDDYANTLKVKSLVGTFGVSVQCELTKSGTGRVMWRSTISLDAEPPDECDNTTS